MVKTLKCHNFDSFWLIFRTRWNEKIELLTLSSNIQFKKQPVCTIYSFQLIKKSTIQEARHESTGRVGHKSTGGYLSMCLLSGVTPMNLAGLDSLKSMVKLPTLMGIIVHILIQVNMTTFVFRALNFSPLNWHHLLMVLRVLYVLSQITSVSLPSANDKRSFAKACR